MGWASLHPDYRGWVGLAYAPITAVLSKAFHSPAGGRDKVASRATRPAAVVPQRAEEISLGPFTGEMSVDRPTPDKTLL
jgi:hypothetical protein